MRRFLQKTLQVTSGCTRTAGRGVHSSGGQRSPGSPASAAAAVKDDLPEMPPCDYTPPKYQDIEYDTVVERRRSQLAPGPPLFYSKPLLLHQGHMQYLFDHEGNRYLDLFAGIVTVSVGHCQPKVTNALSEQINKLWHTTHIYLQPEVYKYTEKLLAKMPGDLKCVYFVNSGSEANDLAMFLARLHTGAFDILSFRNGYHGASPHLMGVTALSTWRYQVPTGFGIQQTQNPDVYAGVWGGANCRDSPVQTDRTCACAPGECHANKMYLDQLEEVLTFSMPKGNVAGFFAEAIQGVGGTVQYPRGYLKKAFEMVREKGGVCIADEVQTGFGRTGTHYWGFEGHEVMPDIVTMAKGIGNGFPMAAVVTTPKIAQKLSQASHFNTFGGNPMASAVGSAVLDVIDEEKIQEKAHHLGTHMLLELAKLRSEFEIVGDVRGKGLMIGVEMVTDKESRTPLPADEMNVIWNACKDMGVLLGKGGIHLNTFRIKPPMCITQADVDFAVAVFRKAVRDHLASK